MADAIVLCALIAVTFAVYANTIRGDFVYDDRTQIVANPYIRSDSSFTKAMLIDVWAFQGEGIQGNYWRPTFVAWIVLNYRLFGLDPAGWHLGNIFLHAVVVALIFGFLRRLELELELAAAVALLFAVHPAQVESVAWISGSPNLLLAVPLLGALWLSLNDLEHGSTPARGASAALFAVAILAKEVAVIFPALVFCIVWWFTHADQPPAGRWRVALRAAIPYAVLAAAYLLGRWMILGYFQLPPEMGVRSLLATIPSALTFYLRQAFFPYWIALAHPLRPVTRANIGLDNFVIPCAVLLVAAPCLYCLARKSAQARFGAALFGFSLAPALLLTAFPPEELVHDRYLYLPLVGLLMLVIVGLRDGFRDWFSMADGASRRIILGLALVAALPLAAATGRFSQVWLNEGALFRSAAEADPSSALYLMLHAKHLTENGRLTEADAVLEKLLNRRPRPEVYLFRAEIALDQRRFGDAEQWLLVYLDRYGPSVAAYDRLVYGDLQRHRLDQGIARLRLAREELPDYYCYFTDKIALLLREAGRREEAKKLLEAVRDRVAGEPWDASRLVLFNLGNLYLEEGRNDDARQALEEFAALCAECTEPKVQVARERALGLLRRLRSEP